MDNLLEYLRRRGAEMDELTTGQRVRSFETQAADAITELRSCIWYLLESLKTPAPGSLEEQFHEMNRKGAINYANMLLGRPSDSADEAKL